MPTRLPMFFVLLLLSGLLLAAAGAQAASAGPIAASSVFEEDFEDFEGELGEEESEEESVETECETAHEEADEGELGFGEVEEICAEAAEAGKKKRDAGKKKASPNAVAPEECLLRSAHAHAALDEKSSKLKVTLGYTTYEPTSAKIEIGHIATVQRHLGRSGVLRLVKDLGKLNAPKKIVVGIRIPSVKRTGCPSRRLVLFPR